MEISKEKIEAYRKTLYQIIFKTDTRAGKIFDIVLLILILVSVLSTVADSIIVVHDRFRLAFKILEWFITTCFTAEYILRIYCSPQPKKYILSFYGIIDLLAIMPTYLNVFFKGAHHLTVIRLLRLLRIFRIFKLTHFVKESKYLLQAIRQSIAKIVVFIFFVILLVTILGTIMYVVEGHVNRGFSDIPKAIYWAIVTLTTVGYGDITPITVLGQLIAAIIMLLGYAIIAVPTGIISAEMIKPFYGKRKWTICRNCGENNHDKEAIYCKHCGTKLDE
ncbi:MAG: ion transporter [Bacteroidales bacterium]|nr:ion transporter [Bacteroidales bacterium]